MEDRAAGVPPPAEARYPRVPLERSAAAADAAVAVLVLAALLLLPAALAPVLRGTRAGIPGGWYLWAVVNGLLILAAVALLLRHRGQTPAAIGLGRAPVK